MKYSNIFYAVLSTFKQTFVTGSSRLIILYKQVLNPIFIEVYFYSYIYLMYILFYLDHTFILISSILLLLLNNGMVISWRILSKSRVLLRMATRKKKMKLLKHSEFSIVLMMMKRRIIKKILKREIIMTMLR